MITRMFVVSACVSAALWFAPAIAAQDKNTPAVGAQDKNASTVRAQDRKADGSAVNVTGCLALGDERNEFSIKDANGKTYGLKAGSEWNLKAHVGHKVTVAGTPIQEKKEKVKAGKVEEDE